MSEDELRIIYPTSFSRKKMKVSFTG